jgi:hypothetical protein
MPNPGLPSLGIWHCLLCSPNLFQLAALTTFGIMRTSLCFLLICLRCLVATSPALAAPKSHVLSFGKWQTVEWLAGSVEAKPVIMRIRPLYVDGKLREYTVGPPHDITERLFVVRRAVRLNDALPEEAPSPKLWRWERGGWLSVDRLSGRVTAIVLPDFDPFYSAAAWYRDYVAYCGVSEDSRSVSVRVVQVGRKKPLLHKPLGAVDLENKPDSACPSPVWFRNPMRVEFQLPGGQKLTFSPRHRDVDVVTAGEGEPAEEDSD